MITSKVRTNIFPQIDIPNVPKYLIFEERKEELMRETNRNEPFGFTDLSNLLQW